MNDIVSTPPAPSSPATSKVTSGIWWPDIDVNLLREEINLAGEIPHQRLLEAIRWGVIVVTSELASWQAEKLDAGFAALEDVAPDDKVDDEPKLVHLFRMAVSAQAAARLMQRNPDLTATREGSDRGDQRRATADDFLADATHAIRQIKGEPRTVSELI